MTAHPLTAVIAFLCGLAAGIAGIVGLCVAQHMGWLRRKAGW